MNGLGNRLYISSVAADAGALAGEYGLGIEIADYCTAWNMDEHYPETHEKVLKTIRGARDVTFHAPFSELCPAAIDLRVREITKERYRQALALTGQYGARKLVIHSGFIPTVYFPEWFIEQSVRFWREFLSEVPPDMTVCLENVMEPLPDIPVEIVGAVDDPRLRLCLDIGHAHTEHTKATPEQWICRFLPYLSHVHLHNNDGDRDTHQSLGQGTIPMEPLLRELSERQELTFTVENMEARPSVEWLCEHRFL